METILSAMSVARYRIIASLSFVSFVVLAWAWNIRLMKAMGPMPISMPGMEMWTVSNVVALWTMWFVMMVAMMLPSVSPTLYTFAAMQRRNGNRPTVIARTGFFVTGYVAGWTAFCVVATVAQWALHAAALLSPMMVSASARLSGLLLLFAGIFQWTTLKHKCLSHCRSPIGFLLNEWREGLIGSVVMGFRHGLYCVGCCWLLMALLFVVGVMNLLWVALISAVVLAEKVFPYGDKLAKFTGIVLVAWGAWLLI
jgi:predicted metal-binding membrane protein